MAKFKPKKNGTDMDEKFIPEDEKEIPVRTHTSDHRGHSVLKRFTIPKNWIGLANRLKEIYPEAKSPTDMDRIIYYRGMIYCYRDRKTLEEAIKKVRPVITLLLSLHDYLNDLDTFDYFKDTVNEAAQYIKDGKGEEEYIQGEIVPVLDLFKTEKIKKQARNYMMAKLFPLKKVKG